MWGMEGLYGRPRPVSFAHLWRNAITPPPPRDHQRRTYDGRAMTCPLPAALHAFFHSPAKSFMVARRPPKA